jgi:hypothetical protein
MNKKVRIFRPHTHGGVKHTPGPEGIELEVSEKDAAWLEANGVTKKPEPEAVAAAPKPAAN